MLFHPSRASGPALGSVLFIQPFAEEMNKSRRAVARTARALSARGWNVLLFDLAGCGDSSGDFRDATWPVWVEDVAEAFSWLEKRTSSRPIVWGLRLGALLAAESFRNVEGTVRFLFWQPVLSGRQFLTQFLRLKVASTMVGDDPRGTNTKVLMERLRAGEIIEIAGYALSGDLALPLERAELELKERHVLWCEVVAEQADAVLSPASERRIASLQDAGCTVTARAVADLPFWQTQEIAECPALEQATCDLLNAQAVS
jgi:exosortase A-associated hydrolase 2